MKTSIPVNEDDYDFEVRDAPVFVPDCAMVRARLFLLAGNSASQHFTGAAPRLNPLTTIYGTTRSNIGVVKSSERIV